MVDVVTVGSEFLVNTQTASFQDLPSITGLAGGGFVATWVDYSASSGLGVAKAQLYSAAGAKVGTEFAVSSGAAADQSFPTVASLANGGFVVTWTEAGVQSDYKIKAQVYAANGTVTTPGFLVNTLTWTQQGGNNLPGIHNPTITGLNGGGFVVTWQDYGASAGDGSGAGVLAQVYSAAGVPAGSAVLVNTQTTGDQTQPVVTSLASGGFVVTWMDASASGTLLKAQLFSASGAKVGSEFAVDTEVLGDTALPVVTGLTSGGFVVAWQDSSPATGEPATLIRAQMFDAAGAKVGSTLVVSAAGAGERDYPSVTSMPDGGFVVTWQHFVSATDSEIKAQFYDGTGAKVGSEITVNTLSGDYQERPVISSLLGGGFVIAWGDSSGLGGDSDGTSIKAQLFSYGSYNLIMGTAAVNTLTGASGDDHIIGLASNDTLTGLGGNDRLDGGTGGDRMFGGLGDDTYVVDSTGDVVSEAAAQGTDTVLTTRAGYTLGNNLENLTFTDNGVHTGIGNSLNNTLTGGGGNDVLDGRGGADRMLGGLGNDRYYIDNAADTTIEAAAAGTDTVFSAISWTLAAHVEDLTLSGTSTLSGTGNGDANVITGNTAANTLTGLGGNDTLNGGAGADVMIGGLGDDRYVVDTISDVMTELAGQGTDLVTASLSWTLTANFENLTLSGSAGISGTGNGHANVLTGNTGANTLTGFGGNDRLDGGSGNDTMIGGLGDDAYVVDSSADVVTELSGEGTDTVLTNRSSYTLGNHIENLTFTNASGHSGTGNALANVITGHAGNDTLNGAAGADTLIGGLGNDSYLVDVSGDVVTELAGQGTDRVTSSASYVLAANIENLTLSGSSAINGTGNGEANAITGNSAANTLAGLDGADTLAGGLGNDTLLGGTGADTFVFNTSPSASTNLDTVQDFAAGRDKLAFSRAVFTSFAVTGAISADAFWSGAGVNAAHDATDRLIYNTTTGVLWYDRDGTGSSAAVQVAVLTGAPGLAFADFQIIA